jgi:hypothetical protein
MDRLTFIAAAASIVTAFGTIAIAAIAWWQLSAIAAQTRLQGERERKWRTLEICSRMDTDPLLDKTTLRIWEQSQGGTNYDDLLPVRRDIINLLNYLDSIAVGIGQGFYVEEVARDHLESIYRKAVGEFLTEERARRLDLHTRDYDHLIVLAARWKSSDTKFKGGVS